MNHLQLHTFTLEKKGLSNVFIFIEITSDKIKKKLIWEFFMLF